MKITKRWLLLRTRDLLCFVLGPVLATYNILADDGDLVLAAIGIGMLAAGFFLKARETTMRKEDSEQDREKQKSCVNIMRDESKPTGRRLEAANFVHANRNSTPDEKREALELMTRSINKGGTSRLE